MQHQEERSKIRNQNNVSELSDMFTRRQLFQ
jgi:hypothetical protein